MIITAGKNRFLSQNKKEQAFEDELFCLSMQNLQLNKYRSSCSYNTSSLYTAL